MAALPPPRRSFQRSRPDPHSNLDGERSAKTSFYRRLVQVAFRNDYYPEPGASPDFSVAPTAATAERMRGLGLLFRAGAAGFAVLYDERRTDELIASLRRDAAPAVMPPEVWSRLTFVLRLENPCFTNFSKIPLDFDPAAKNFYFTNQEAHRSRRGVLLNPGRSVSGASLRRLIPSQISLAVGPRVREVEVCAISGEVVQCRPRCFPRELARRMPPNAISCQDVAAFLQSFGSSPQEEICRNKLWLDFGLLPEDRYVVREVGGDGEVLRQRDVLWSQASPIPFALIDLLFTQPRRSERGIYPVRGLWTRPRVAGVDYELVFERRSTTWRYYVVLPRAADTAGLRIQSLVPPAERFAGPRSVRLADGTQAWLFEAEQELPLQARSDARFVLRSDAGVLLHPLPVASSLQVLPIEDGTGGQSPGGARSDIYVYV